AVLKELEAATRALAVELEYVKDDGWSRRAYRDGLEMTVAWMARNAVHEGRHHLLDIGRALRSARRAGRTGGDSRPVA
ncbi:MAG TPA: DinB family protein, partial [Acidimicrobiia bacterium]|nr:DinB family protein [Acidimicrobiia bacterium]